MQGIGDGYTCAILCTVAKTCSNTGTVLCGLSCRMQCAPRVQESDEFRSSPSFCRPVTIGTEDRVVQTPGVLIDAEYFPFSQGGLAFNESHPVGFCVGVCVCASVPVPSFGCACTAAFVNVFPAG